MKEMEGTKVRKGTKKNLFKDTKWGAQSVRMNETNKKVYEHI